MPCRKKQLVVSLAVVGALLGGGLAPFTTGIYAKGLPGGVYSITFLGAEVYEYVGPWDNFSTIANVWLLGLMLLFGVIGAAVGGTVGGMLSRRTTSVGPDGE
jgi:hypothetical protein